MQLLVTSPHRPQARVLLAHGAGAPMDSEFMNVVADLLVKRNIACIRFEFAYMAQRRVSGKRQPAPRGDKLLDEYRAAVQATREKFTDDVPIVIGGKSLGGRVASMVCGELYRAHAVSGLVCLGYPFHPSGKPDRLRTAHLHVVDCPALIIQGSRDALGNREEVDGYDLDQRIQLHWLADGDHDLKPRKVSGHTWPEHLACAADAISDFALTCAMRGRPIDGRPV